MSQGRIWPEYWIDCSGCDHHEPLAESDQTRAVQEALRRGWLNLIGKWKCPKCIEKAKAKP